MCLYERGNAGKVGNEHVRETEKQVGKRSEHEREEWQRRRRRSDVRSTRVPKMTSVAGTRKMWKSRNITGVEQKEEDRRTSSGHKCMANTGWKLAVVWTDKSDGRKMDRETRA